MQNKSTIPANQESPENTKKTWQEPELNSLSVDGGNLYNIERNNGFFYNS